MKAVDNVTGNEERNSKPGLLNGNALVLVHLYGIYLVEDGTHLTVTDCAGIIAYLASYRDLVHLADFLRESHLPEDRINSFIHFTFTLTAGNGRYHSGDKQKQS